MLQILIYPVSLGLSLLTLLVYSSTWTFVVRWEFELLTDGMETCKHINENIGYY